jgi:hypothetical protein
MQQQLIIASSAPATAFRTGGCVRGHHKFSAIRTDRLQLPRTGSGKAALAKVNPRRKANARKRMMRRELASGRSGSGGKARE